MRVRHGVQTMPSHDGPSAARQTAHAGGNRTDARPSVSCLQKVGDVAVET